MINLDGIVKVLEKDHQWTSQDQDIPELESCPFCGGRAIVMARNPMYGLCGANVRCCQCGAEGPRASIYARVKGSFLSTLMTAESVENGILAAVSTWNSREVRDCRILKSLVVSPKDAQRREKVTAHG